MDKMQYYRKILMEGKEEYPDISIYPVVVGITRAIVTREHVPKEEIVEDIRSLMTALELVEADV